MAEVIHHRPRDMEFARRWKEKDDAMFLSLRKAHFYPTLERARLHELLKEMRPKVPDTLKCYEDFVAKCEFEELESKYSAVVEKIEIEQKRLQYVAKRITLATDVISGKEHVKTLKASIPNTETADMVSAINIGGFRHQTE